MKIWSSEERRIALEQISKAITERSAGMRDERHGVSAEACEEFQTMQVAIDLQCRLNKVQEFLTVIPRGSVLSVEAIRVAEIEAAFRRGIEGAKQRGVMNAGA